MCISVFCVGDGGGNGVVRLCMCVCALCMTECLWCVCVYTVCRVDRCTYGSHNYVILRTRFGLCCCLIKWHINSMPKKLDKKKFYDAHEGEEIGRDALEVTSSLPSASLLSAIIQWTQHRGESYRAPRNLQTISCPFQTQNPSLPQIHQVWQIEWDEAVIVSTKLHEILSKLSDKLFL